MQNGIWWGNPLHLLKRTANEASNEANSGSEVRNSAVVMGLPVLGAILMNALLFFPWSAVLPVMLCITTTPSDTYCWLLLWLTLPWLAVAWWVVAAFLWKLIFVGSFLSNFEPATAVASGPLRDRVRELNEVVMFAVNAACEPIKGTPLYNGVLRSFGMRVGRKVCWLGKHCPEPDLLSVGDGTLVAPGVDFFTHNREAVSYVFEVSSTCQDGHRLRVV